MEVVVIYEDMLLCNFGWQMAGPTTNNAYRRLYKPQALRISSNTNPLVVAHIDSSLHANVVDSRRDRRRHLGSELPGARAGLKAGSGPAGPRVGGHAAGAPAGSPGWAQGWADSPGSDGGGTPSSRGWWGNPEPRSSR